MLTMILMKLNYQSYMKNVKFESSSEWNETFQPAFKLLKIKLYTKMMQYDFIKIVPLHN